MPQDLFDACAVVIAKYKDFEAIECSAKELSAIHRNYYIDDGFEEDLITAAHNVVKFAETVFPDKNYKINQILPQIQYLINNCHPNGKKRFFKGAWFNRQKTPLPDRVKQCMHNVMVFHFGTLNGMFPLAPEK
jgi:hypothetical protein